MLSARGVYCEQHEHTVLLPRVLLLLQRVHQTNRDVWAAGTGKIKEKLDGCTWFRRVWCCGKEHQLEHWTTP